MRHSIQEIVKKINSRLSVMDSVSIVATGLSVMLFASYLHLKAVSTVLPVMYKENPNSTPFLSNDSKPFGSMSGKTYTFAWCTGASQIKDKNKVYFETAGLAEKAGRTLSKLCQK